MNKPAPKEPSMDEILSSIRQIIADDDAAVLPKALAPLAAAPARAPQPQPPGPRPLGSLGGSPAAAAAPPPVPPRPDPAMAAPPRPVLPEPQPAPARPEPLALSAEQILSDAEADSEDEEQLPVMALSFADILGGNSPMPEPDAAFGEAQLVDPEDIAFDVDVDVGDEPEPEPELESPALPVQPERAAMPPRAPFGGMRAVPPAPAAPRPPVRPAPSVAQAAPMPDPDLSADIAEQLLEPATTSAVKHAFARLNGMSMVNTGVTIEEMMRDLLRPMLKEWLDENLPAIVERMVEKEIARVSRGVE